MALLRIFAAVALFLPTLTVASSDTRTDASPRVLMVVTSHDRLGNTDEKTGVWLSEVTHPYYEFVDGGCDVTFTSPQGGRPPVDPRSAGVEDEANGRFGADSVAQNLFSHSLLPDSISAADFDIIFFAGGHGTMWDFPDSRPLADLAAAVYQNGGSVGAVCHGPAALINVKLSDGSYLVDGKQVTGFTNEEEQARGLATIVPYLLQDKLTERGARFVPGPKWGENVVVSGRLVTGQNPASAKGVAERILQQLMSTKTGR